MSRQERNIRIVRDHFISQRKTLKNQERNASIDESRAEREKAEIRTNIDSIKDTVLNHGTLTVPDNPRHLGISIKTPNAYAQVFPRTEKSPGIIYFYQSKGPTKQENRLENIVQQFWIFEQIGEAVHIVNTNFPEMHQFQQTPDVTEGTHNHEGFFEYTGTIDTFSREERTTILELTKTVLGELEATEIARS